MKGYVTISEDDSDEIQIRFGAYGASPDGQPILGDARVILRPGDAYGNWTYEQLLARGSGACEFEEPATPSSA